MRISNIAPFRNRHVQISQELIEPRVFPIEISHLSVQLKARVALKIEATDFIRIKAHPKGLFYGDILERLDIKFYRCQISNEIGK